MKQFSEINIDGALIKQGEAKLSRVDEKIIELQNGCICCTLREGLKFVVLYFFFPIFIYMRLDLLVEIVKLAKQKVFDYLLIESSGISEPLQVAETFTFADSEGNSLSNLAQLDTCVTVVDCFNWLKDYNSKDSLQNRGQATSPKDSRNVTDLLIEQVEFANVIILNKIDLVSKDELKQLEGIMKKLNPDSKIIHSVYSKIDLTQVLNTNLFSIEKAEQQPGWLKVMQIQGSIDE